jgi:hypothetical protein
VAGAGGAGGGAGAEVSLGSPSKAALRRIQRMGSPSSGGELLSFPMHCLAQHQTRATMGKTREKTRRKKLAETRRRRATGVTATSSWRSVCVRESVCAGFVAGPLRRPTQGGNQTQLCVEAGTYSYR